MRRQRADPPAGPGKLLDARSHDASPGLFQAQHVHAQEKAKGPEQGQVGGVRRVAGAAAAAVGPSLGGVAHVASKQPSVPSPSRAPHAPLLLQRCNA